MPLSSTAPVESKPDTLSLDVLEPNRWVVLIARLGYATKGLIYTIVGLLALRAAWGVGSEDGTNGALAAIGRQPFGQWLLSFTAIGLLGYVFWRLVQAWGDPDHEGRQLGALVRRSGYLISAGTYLVLAWIAATAALDGYARESGEEAKRAWTAWTLELPLGEWLVGFVGVVVVGVGLHHFWRVHRATFVRQYHYEEMSVAQLKWARRVGRVGLLARGATFCIIGGFLIVAAVYTDPDQVKGLGEAIQAMAGQDYAPWLLATVALGFIAYGVYCFSRAKYRYFRPMLRARDGRSSRA